jgi:predicted O-linked N-acetylglucosamine transferase (SPINDLY family)
VANVLADLGRLEESVAAYRQCLRLDPDNREAHSNLLMTLHSLPGVTSADLLAEARAYGGRLEPQPQRAFANPPGPERPLRIGYVSADFRVHPVGFFLDRVLPSHDPAKVQAILYSDTLFPDELSARLQTHARWQSTVGKSHAEMLAAVQADQVDILVDLAGHTGSNRLPLFAQRAAPVQMAWLGYFGTTGLSAIDYLLADEIVLPPGEEALFTEKPLGLGAPYLCWSPPTVYPRADLRSDPGTEVPLAPPPALARGFVTFGCFNNPRKITDQAIETWAGIMSRVPASRLLMKYWSHEDAACRARFVRAFAARGIGGDRLAFEGLEPRVEALAAYNRVDIALDPFPFGGCTTTADTLWMGVPVVGLVGDRWSGRMSLDILSSLGLQDWATPDLGAYADTAVRLAADLDGLAALRRELRPRLEASAFCDGPAFTARLEGAYRQAWRAWCAGKQGP